MNIPLSGIARTVGSYSEYQAASGSQAASVAFVDATRAAGEISQNWTHPEYLTWDSFFRKLSGPGYGYPAAQIQALLNLAWPFLPEKVRSRLLTREQAAAPPPPAPPASAPVHPPPPGTTLPAHLSGGLPTPIKVAIGVGVGLAAFNLFMLLKRTKKAA